MFGTLRRCALQKKQLAIGSMQTGIWEIVCTLNLIMKNIACSAAEEQLTECNKAEASRALRVLIDHDLSLKKKCCQCHSGGEISNRR